MVNAIPKEEHITEIEKMLNEGLQIDEITANQLQKRVGGRYSNITKMLQEYKTEYTKKINEKHNTPQPIWFQNITNTITESITTKL